MKKSFLFFIVLFFCSSCCECNTSAGDSEGAIVTYDPTCTSVPACNRDGAISRIGIYCKNGFEIIKEDLEKGVIRAKCLPHPTKKTSKGEKNAIIQD